LEDLEVKICLFFAAGFAAAAAYAADVQYISGGVGVEEREQMQSAAKDYNLHLVFSQKETGAYVAEISVSIKDAKGEEILQVVSDGPWLYAQLPAGTYTVTVAQAGRAISRQVKVTGEKSQTLYFQLELKG
jgi:hypothetical protein